MTKKKRSAGSVPTRVVTPEAAEVSEPPTETATSAVEAADNSSQDPDSVTVTPPDEVGAEAQPELKASQEVPAEPSSAPAISEVPPLPTAEITPKKSAVKSGPVWNRFSRRQIQRTVAVIAGSLVLLVGVWTLCSVYQSKITIGGGAPVSATMNDAELTKTLSKRVDAYKLTLQYPDGKQQAYALSQVGFQLDSKASIMATRQQLQEFGHRFTWWQPVPATLKFKQNTKTLDNFVATAAHITVQPSKDAVLSISGGIITITDAVTGKQYGLTKPEATFAAAARQLRAKPIRLQTLAVSPALTAHSLEAYKPLLEKTLNQSITLAIGSKVVTPTPADIADWLEITPDEKTKKVDIVVNSGKVQAYIDKKAAADIHPAKAQIETKRDDGTTQILVAGTNGMDVPDKAATASAIAKDLLRGEGLTLTLPIHQEQFQTINTGTYDKWIEVDLTTKRLYAYEKTSLVKTDLVSAGAPETPTVTGQYAVYRKFAVQDMKGRNVDGSKYFQPNVRFINYFYQDYAIHGNYWRPLNYFGNINSSHGCVSMPEPEAEWIYNWAPIGTPVIVHT